MKMLVIVVDNRSCVVTLLLLLLLMVMFHFPFHYQLKTNEFRQNKIKEKKTKRKFVIPVLSIDVDSCVAVMDTVAADLAFFVFFIPIYHLHLSRNACIFKHPSYFNEIL